MEYNEQKQKSNRTYDEINAISNRIKVWIETVITPTKSIMEYLTYRVPPFGSIGESNTVINVVRGSAQTILEPARTNNTKGNKSLHGPVPPASCQAGRLPLIECILEADLYSPPISWTSRLAPAGHASKNLPAKLSKSASGLVLALTRHAVQKLRRHDRPEGQGHFHHLCMPELAVVCLHT